VISQVLFTSKHRRKTKELPVLNKVTLEQVKLKQGGSPETNKQNILFIFPYNKGAHCSARQESMESTCGGPMRQLGARGRVSECVNK